MPRSSAAARPLTDHDEIKQWAEDRGARPSRVSGTGVAEDVGMIRLDFPGYSGGESLEEISWGEWFENFDDRNLALMVQDETASGEISNFNKLVSRDTAKEAAEESEVEARSRNQGAAGTRPKRTGARAASRRGARSRGRRRSWSGSRSAKATSSKRSSRSTGRSSRSSRSTSHSSRSTQARSAKRRGAHSSRSSESRRRAA